jgi:hypothetical protein
MREWLKKVRIPMIFLIVTIIQAREVAIDVFDGIPVANMHIVWPLFFMGCGVACFITERRATSKD